MDALLGSKVNGDGEAMNTSANSGEAAACCIVCDERPPLNPRGDYPTCGTCRSAICRLRKLEPPALGFKTRRAITRLKRIVAARWGVAHRVVLTQYVLNDSDSQTLE